MTERWKHWLKRVPPRVLGPFAVGIVVSLVGAVESCSLLRSASSTKREDKRYLVAVRDLPAAHPVAMLDYSLTHKGTSGALTDQDWPLLKGARLKIPLQRGEVLTPAHVEGGSGLVDRLSPGARAYPVVAEGASSLRSGDRIDLLYRGERSDNLPGLVAQNLLVLRVNREDSELWVAARSSEIELLEMARQRGTLAVALRRPDEAIVAPPRRGRSRRMARRIDVWAEGGAE